MRFWAAPRLFLIVPGGQQQPGVADLVRRARIYAGHLFDQMERLGLTFGWQSWEQLDGSRVTVYCHGDFDTGFVQARIVVVPSLTPSSIINIWRLYSGWLAWHPSAYPGGQPPALVYLAQQLQDYWGSAGTVLPWGTEQMVGEATATTAEVCASGHPAPHWLEPLPELDAANSYQWPLAMPADEAPQIWRFTGEARAKAQAEFGAGKPITLGLPEPWALDAANVGIFWAPNHTLWAARFTTSASQVAVDLVQLMIPDQMQCLVPELGSASGVDFKLIKAWLYAFASAAANATIHTFVIEVSGSPDWLSIGASLHPFFGWQSYWQTRLDDPAKVIQTFNWSASDSMLASTVTIELLWNEQGIPDTPTMNVTTAQGWGGEVYRYWVPTGQGLEVALAQVVGESNTADVVVYTYTTTKGGAVQVTKLAVTGPEYVDYGQPPLPTICGAGDAYWEQGSYSVSGAGGWSAISDDADILGRIEINSARNTEAHVVSITPSVTISVDAVAESGKTSRADFFNWGTDNICSGELSGEISMFSTAHDGSYFHVQMGDRSNDATVIVASNGSGGAFLVLLPTDNGVAIGARQTWGAGTHKSYHSEVDYNPAVSGSGTVVSWDTRQVNTNTNPDTDIHATGTALHHATRRCYVFVAYENSVSFGQHCIGFSLNLSGTPITNTADSKATKYVGLLASDGNAKPLAYDDWIDLFEQGAGASASAPFVSVSAFGEVMSNTLPGKEMGLPEGLNAAVAGHTMVAPIGAA